MVHRSLAVSVAVAATACAIAIASSAGQAASRSQTLTIFDKPVSITLTHPDGTVVKHAPYPEAKSGDTLDVDSLDYQGTHAKHSKRWIGSSHLRCKFTGNGAPNCESHFALGGSMLVFTGNPGTLTNGTGIYQGATGRVISTKEVADDATDFVARIQLRG